MLELLVMGTAGVYGHLKSKDFVRRRLRYTKFVERPGMGLMTGAAAAVVAAPIVAVLPFVGAATAIAAGVGIGTGVAIGANQARKGGPISEDEF